jgi:hypothetical protein
MMKTALSIINSVRYRMNLSALATLVTPTDPDELQMIHLLYAVCEELRQSRCWPQLKRYYTFETVDTVKSYQLPLDFYSSLLQTHWNEEESMPLISSVSDGEFAAYLHSGSPASTNYTWRPFGRDENPASSVGQFVVNPTPSAAQTLSFEYLTRSFLLPRNWVAGATFAAGSYCNASGNIYYTAAGGVAGATVPSHSTGSVSDGTVLWAYNTAPYELVLADTDLVVFDDDLVKLGLRAKWIEEKGGDYSSAKAEFDGKVDRALCRYKGSHIGTFGAIAGGPSYTTQYKGWVI